jgi:hypothetical protein
MQRSQDAGELKLYVLTVHHCDGQKNQHELNKMEDLRALHFWREEKLKY